MIMTDIHDMPGVFTAPGPGEPGPPFEIPPEVPPEMPETSIPLEVPTKRPGEGPAAPVPGQEPLKMPQDTPDPPTTTRRMKAIVVGLRGKNAGIAAAMARTPIL